MSIIICVVEKNKTFYIASDKRAIKNGIINDDYKKIYELKKRLYFAMTGIAEIGLVVLDKIKNKVNYPIKDFINMVEREIPINATKLTITIAGLDENNRYFIWQKNNLGEITNADIGSDKIAYSISGNDEIGLFRSYFEKCVISGKPIQYCIANTINYASSIDNSISSKYELIQFCK